MKKLKKRVIVKKPNMKTLSAMLATLACTASIFGCFSSAINYKNQTTTIERDCMNNNPAYAQIVEYELQKVQDDFDNGDINRGEYFSKSNKIINEFNESFFEEVSSEEQMIQYEKAKDKSTSAQIGAVLSTLGTGISLGLAVEEYIMNGLVKKKIKEIEVDEDEQVMY